MDFWWALILALATTSAAVPWKNHGGGLENLRYRDESSISVHSAYSLKKRWQFSAGSDISATPSIDEDGRLFFPSWNGLLFAVNSFTGAYIWGVNLSVVTGVPGALSRTTPVIVSDSKLKMLLVSIYGPPLVASLELNTGRLIWISEKLDNNTYAQITMSGTPYNGNYYIGVSSSEELVEDCCTFQGSFQKLDLVTGKVRWRTSMLPYNGGQQGQYAGAAVWGSSPSIDVRRKLVYIATGNLYSAPDEVEQCEEENANRTNPITPDPCLPENVHQESVLALDLYSGKIQWARRLGGFDVFTVICQIVSPPPSNCPDVLGPDYDFGQSPLLRSVKERDSYGRTYVRDIAVTAQKSGVVWALDRGTGETVWSTVAGPGGSLGGSLWGSAADEENVYIAIGNNERRNFTLVPSSAVTTSGGWVGVRLRDGQVIWTTANPSNASAYGPVTVVNGVVLVGSFDREGHVYGLDSRNGKVLWCDSTNATVYGGFSVDHGCGFVGSDYATPFGLAIGGTPGCCLHAFCVN